MNGWLATVASTVLSCGGIWVAVRWNERRNARHVAEWVDRLERARRARSDPSWKVET